MFALITRFLILNLWRPQSLFSMLLLFFYFLSFLGSQNHEMSRSMIGWVVELDQSLGDKIKDYNVWSRHPRPALLRKSPVGRDVYFSLVGRSPNRPRLLDGSDSGVGLSTWFDHTLNFSVGILEKKKSKWLGLAKVQLVGTKQFFSFKPKRYILTLNAARPKETVGLMFPPAS